MKFTTIEKLKEKGWKIKYETSPQNPKSIPVAAIDMNNQEYVPDDITHFHREMDLWYYIARLENSELASDHIWTDDQSVALLDDLDYPGLEVFESENLAFNEHTIVLTPSDLAALNLGKCIAWCHGDETTIIYFSKEKKPE